MITWATAAFAVMGFHLFYSGRVRLENGTGPRALPYLMAFGGGLTMAAAVWMRYSTVVACAAPCLLCLIWLFKDWRAGRRKEEL